MSSMVVVFLSMFGAFAQPATCILLLQVLVSWGPSIFRSCFLVVGSVWGLAPAVRSVSQVRAMHPATWQLDSPHQVVTSLRMRPSLVGGGHMASIAWTSLVAPKEV